MNENIEKESNIHSIVVRQNKRIRNLKLENEMLRDENETLNETNELLIHEIHELKAKLKQLELFSGLHTITPEEQEIIEAEDSYIPYTGDDF